MNAKNPTVGEQLGLGPMFAPSPASWAWAQLMDPNDPAAPTMYVLIFDTATGRVALPFDRDSLGRFAAQATEQATGLAVARQVPNGGPYPFRGLDGIG